MMKRATLSRLFLVLFAVALIQACATVVPASVDFQPDHYDPFFPGFGDVDTIARDDIFYLDEQSKAYVRERAALAETTNDKALALINDLMSPSQFALDYVYGANAVAQETFDNGTANCLSLTILAYAMAQEADLEVRFQEVFEEESWNQAGEFDLANGHVNLLVSRKSRFSFVPGMMAHKRTYTVDFFPESREGRVKTKELSKTQIESYFYSNIGARAMIDGQYNRAWANFRIALSLFPQDSSARNNLALLLSRQGALNEAIVALQTATELDNKNYTAWENLAGMLKKSGNTESAESITTRLNRIRQDNPNHHVRIGNRHFLNEDWQQAELAYRKSVRLQKNNHLAWFGLAKLAANRGNESEVREYLSKAKEAANSEGFARRYARKLHALNETL